MGTQSVAALIILLVAGGQATKLAQPAHLSQQLMKYNQLTRLGQTVVINHDIDEMVPGIVEFMMNNDLDPMPLPDLQEGFYYNPLLIQYRGQLWLSQGRLHNMKSMHRSGDAWVSSFANMLRFHVEFGFTDLEFNYNYLAQVMDIGPTGGVVGSLNRMDIILDVLFDCNNDELHLQHFNISYQRLRVGLTGNFLTDWFVSPVIAVISRLFDDTIMRYMEDTIRANMQDEIAHFNAHVDKGICDLQ